MKKLVVLTAAFLLISVLASAAEENMVDIANYYQSGMQYLKADQYTKAIAEFKKALRDNPGDISSKIQLTNSYLARAAYYNNKAEDYKAAANDLRSAIFYMKYYDVTPIDPQTLNNINITEGNLDTVLSAINADKTSKGHFDTGKSLRAQGEFAAAVTEFQISQSDPKFRKESLIALGEIYYILNLNVQSATYFERALYDDPSNPDIHLKVARVYERMGSFDKAARAYSIALTKSNENQEILISLENIWKQKVLTNPDDAEAHANLGAIYQKKGDLQGALAEYQKAEKLNPSNATTRLNLGTLFQQKKQYEAAIEAYDSILRLYPNNAQAYYYKAQCLRELGYSDAEIQNFKLALNLEPGNRDIQEELFSLYKKDLSPEQKLQFLADQARKFSNDSAKVYEYAFELHKNKRLDEAINYYNQAIRLDPQNPDSYVNLAIAYREKSEFDKAKNILNNAQNLFPDNQELKKQFTLLTSESNSSIYSNATALFSQKKYKEALNLYNKINPQTAESLIGAGACYQALGNNKSAIESYTKASAIQPNNAEIMYYLALAYSNENDLAKAKSYNQKALAVAPGHKGAKELQAYIAEEESSKMMEDAIALYEKQDFSQAFVLLNKILVQNPKDANAYYYCGLIYDEQKKYWPAIESYKKAIQADPNMTIANYSIAVDYDYLTRYKDAVTYFKKYLECTKETNDFTKYAKKRVEELKSYDTP